MTSIIDNTSMIQYMPIIYLTILTIFMSSQRSWYNHFSQFVNDNSQFSLRLFDYIYIQLFDFHFTFKTENKNDYCKKETIEDELVCIQNSDSE